MENKNLPLGYVGGDIMTHGSQLARQEECDKMDAAGLQVTYYSPAQNKSIIIFCIHIRRYRNNCFGS